MKWIFPNFTEVYVGYKTVETYAYKFQRAYNPNFSITGVLDMQISLYDSRDSRFSVVFPAAHKTNNKEGMSLKVSENASFFFSVQL